MGYNRRALNLQRMAQVVVARHKGMLPITYAELVALPGVGPYTAGAVMAFAYNRAHPVIETNIRSVYLHHFFPKKKVVSDRALLPIVERTLDIKNPRRWYWALMDYGAYLKSRVPNPNRRSMHYTRQSDFKGSKRQLRAQVVRTLLRAPRGATLAHLRQQYSDDRLHEVVDGLLRDGLIAQRAKRLIVA
jgi:A/G-specific adenine glycosylase